MRYSVALRMLLIAIFICLNTSFTLSTAADDGEHLLTVDHYVSVRSTVPFLAGQIAQIYVRERLRPGAVLRAASVADRVVLFIHGAGTPAQAAFDVFAMDTTGYGRSTRPTAMNDPCNLTREQQAAFVPSLLSEPCAPNYPRHLTTIASDWNDIGAVVDYIRTLRHVDQVNLVAWSLGGPRAGW